MSPSIMSELSLEPPESIRCGDNIVRCGGTVYRAVKCVLARAGELRKVSLAEFCPAVWGWREVQNETVRSLIWRANQILKELGEPRRLMLCGDAVLFE